MPSFKDFRRRRGSRSRAAETPWLVTREGLRKIRRGHHMAETAQEVFDLHRMQKYEPVLRGVHGTYLFDIDKVGSWFVAVADCTISCEEADFVDIVEGRRQLITSHMQGRVTIRGDMALAQKFHGLVSAKIQEKKPGKAAGSK